MELQLKKNQAAEIMFPMVNDTAPEGFDTGETVADTAYYKDGAGAWTSLAITDTVTEIGTTGVYTIELTAAEMNHDLIIIKLTSTDTADSAVIIRTFERDVDSDFTTTQKASINTEADTALTDYDPPTRAELTTDKNSIITEVDANETKIDTAITDIAAVKTDTAAILIDTDTMEADLTTEINANEAKIDTVITDIAALNDISTAQVNTECDTALSDIDLDHFIQITAGVEEPTDGSYLDQIMHKDAGQTFDASTDSLEAISDSGGGGLTAQQVRDAMKLAPTGGAPAAGSVDQHLDDILTNIAALNDFDYTSQQVVIATNNDKTGYSISGAKTTLDALNDLSAAQVNTEMDNALDTAIPGVPTADSINQRIRSMDLLTEALGAGDLAAIKAKTDGLNFTGTEIDANIKSINGGATDGYNATLKLAMLDIQNSGGDALSAVSSGGNGKGMNLRGNGTGAGLDAQGGLTGAGLKAYGGGTSGIGIDVYAMSGDAVTFQSGFGQGLHCQGSSDGGYFVGGSGKGISASEIDDIKAKTDNLPADPASETNVDANETKIDTAISNIASLQADITRILGLDFENAVWDDWTWSGDNNTGASIYLYDSKANAQTHNKSTGLIGKYTMVATFSGDKPTLQTITKES